MFELIKNLILSELKQMSQPVIVKVPTIFKRVKCVKMVLCGPLKRKNPKVGV